MSLSPRYSLRFLIWLSAIGLLLLPSLAPPAPAEALIDEPVGHLQAPAQGVDIELELIVEDLVRPVYVTAPRGDRARLFVVEKPGRIRIVAEGALLPAPFLDIVSLVRSFGNEQGLFSVAFHPNYDHNGRFYVNYTNLSGDSVIARYSVSADPNLADPGSALVMLTQDQPYGNHNGGQLQFGPDGYLYIGFGDGGWFGDPGNRAQSGTTLLGKMLRIDVDGAEPYAIPPDNPYVALAPLDEIWAFGVRNPWRFSFDRLNGDLWIGDVGQDNWEEIDQEPAGAAGGLNWGWRCKEGTHDFNMSGDCPLLVLEPPVYEYSHSIGCSVTGGYVYRGSPNSDAFGQYLFADYCVSNTVWNLQFDGGGATATQHTLLPPAGYALNTPTSFGQDAIGDLYMADDTGGEVFKLLLRPATCVAGNYDVNGDGSLNIVDVQLVAADWMRPDYVPDHDVNCSGGVDLFDVAEVADAWGT